MTDRELLMLCIDAFDAIPVSGNARKLMKKQLKIVPGAYAGNGSHILAKLMAEKIRGHCNVERR